MLIAFLFLHDEHDSIISDNLISNPIVSNIKDLGWLSSLEYNILLNYNIFLLINYGILYLLPFILSLEFGFLCLNFEYECGTW